MFDVNCTRGERFNCYSHLLGAVAALPGVTVLLVMTVMQADPWKIASVCIYGTTLFLMFLFSSLYHCGQGPFRQRFRQLDHHSVYLLIAGTYTPFSLVTLNGDEGWFLFVIIWTLALLGMAQEALPQPGGRRIFPVILYLIMGWLIVIVLESLLAVLPQNGFNWLLAGGISYTSGVLFYALGRYKRLLHGIWHLFVLFGSACHYWVIIAYVL